MTAAPDTIDRILRLPEVRQRVGLSTSTLYRRVLAGEFPADVPLGGRTVGWRESDIAAWIAGTWQAVQP